MEIGRECSSGLSLMPRISVRGRVGTRRKSAKGEVASGGGVSGDRDILVPSWCARREYTEERNPDRRMGAEPALSEVEGAVRPSPASPRPALAGLLGRDQGLKQSDEHWHVVRRSVPDNVEIDSSVVVNQAVAHPDRLAPGNLRMGLTKPRCYLTRRLPYGLELPNHGVLNHVIGVERFPRSAAYPVADFPGRD